MTDNYGGVALGFFFRGGETPSERGLHAQQVEEIGRDQAGCYALGSSAPVKLASHGR